MHLAKILQEKNWPASGFKRATFRLTLFLIAAGIVIFLSILKYQSVLTQKETMRVNNQYYLLSEQYRNIKKRYPEINNITNLVELYNLEKLVSVKSLNPSDFLKKLFSINTPNIEVISITGHEKETTTTTAATT